MSRRSVYAWLAALLAGAAAVFLYFLPRSYVGVYSDDALYVITAISILHGKFATLCLPHQPPMNHFLPGYPLALAPWIALCGATAEILKLSSVVWTLGAGISLWALARRFFSETASLGLVGLFLFNPLVAKFASILMPEPFTIFLSSLVWWLFARWEEKPGPERLAWLACVLTWACLLRQESLLLAVAVMFSFVLSRHWRAAILGVGPAIATWAAWMIRNLIVTRSLTDYLPQWRPGSEGLGGLFLKIPGRTVSWIRLTFLDVVASIRLPPHHYMIGALSGVLVLAGVLLTFIGWRSLWKTQVRHRALIGGLAVFLSLYSALHIFWYVSDSRYVLPMLPFLWFFIVAGALDLKKRSRLGYAIVMILGIAVGLGYLDQLSYAVHQQRQGEIPEERYLPVQTLAWIRREIAPTSILLSNKIEVIYLHTGRRGYFLPQNLPSREWYPTLRSQNIQYVVYKDAGTLDSDLGERWVRTIEMLGADRSHAELVYANSSEKTVVFRIR